MYEHEIRVIAINNVGISSKRNKYHEQNTSKPQPLASIIYLFFCILIKKEALNV